MTLLPDYAKTIRGKRLQWLRIAALWSERLTSKMYYHKVIKPQLGARENIFVIMTRSYHKNWGQSLSQESASVEKQRRTCFFWSKTGLSRLGIVRSERSLTRASSRSPGRMSEVFYFKLKQLFFRNVTMEGSIDSVTKAVVQLTRR